MTPWCMSLIIQVIIIMKFLSKQEEAKLHACLHCISKFKTHNWFKFYAVVRVFVLFFFFFLFLFLFFCFSHISSVKFIKPLKSVIKHKMKQKKKKRKKERKKRKEKKRKEKREKMGRGVKINWFCQLMCKRRKKNARRPATDLILLSNPAPKYVLILGYRCLSHLLKIYYLNIFDVVSSLIYIHIITFDHLYHADSIDLFLIASKIITWSVYILSSLFKFLRGKKPSNYHFFAI